MVAISKVTSRVNVLIPGDSLILQRLVTLTMVRCKPQAPSPKP